MGKTIKSVEWQNVHIFISSTFNDMHAERDYLVKKVFPRLADWCEKRKMHMVDIDLRWGVPETDTMNKKVISTCLKNIDECRPFFICLLGQRRGWVPKKDDVSSDTFVQYPDISRYIGNTSVTEMEILHALIDPLHKTGLHIRDKSDEYYSPVKHAFFYLRDSSYIGSLPSLPRLLRKTYTNELIENEEERKSADDELKIWREIKIPATNRPVRNYSAQWNAESETPDLRIPLACPSTEPQIIQQWRRLWELAGFSLNERDNEIPEHLREEAKNFNTNFTKGRLGGFKVENNELSDIIFSDLTEAIRKRFHEHIAVVEAESSHETDLQKEIDQQEQFVAMNSVGFIQRTGDFDQLDAYIAGNIQKLFVITAPAGMGKSMFLAKWVDRYRKEGHPGNNESIHFRFIGQSDKSTSLFNLWHTILEEIKEHTGKIKDKIIENDDGSITTIEVIPANPDRLRDSLPDMLHNIGEKGKTIIVLDALNQLEKGLTDLDWLQSNLPEGIKMIVSFKRSSEDLDAENLYKRLKDSAELSEIKPFESTEYRTELIDEYLRQYLKELDQKHINALLELEASKNPLFLKIVLNELRIFGAFLNIKDKIQNDFGNGPLSAFDGVLKRIENDPAYSSLHSKISVPLIFGLIANSRYGLSAEELAYMILTTLGYELNEVNLDQIKQAVYLYLRQVRPYLAKKEERYDFFYESFKIAAQNRYINKNSIFQINDFQKENIQRNLILKDITLITKDWHKILAEYFYELPLWVKKNSDEGRQNQKQDKKIKADYNDDPNKRKVSELPFHMTMAEDWDRVEETLCDLWFVEAKTRNGMVFELIDDYSHALNHIPENQSKLKVEKQKRERVDRWTREIIEYSREWSERRDMLAQSIAISDNEPQLPESPPSCRMWTQKEINEECKRVLDNPSVLDKLNAFAIFVGQESYSLYEFNNQKGFVIQHAYNYAPQGQIHVMAERILPSMNVSLLLRVWSDDDYYNPYPALIKTLHTQTVRNVCITPDGRRAVSANKDRTLRLWDLGKGTCLKVLEGHDDEVLCAGISPDGRCAVSASKDKTLRVWDLENGICLRILKGHDDEVLSVNITPDFRLAISGSKDWTSRIWDVQNGNCLQVLEGHDDEILCVSIAPDGRRAVSASKDETMRVWDLEKKICVRVLKHKRPVTSVSITLDGLHAVAADSRQELLVWDLSDGSCIKPFEENGFAVSCFSITPDFRRMVFATMNNKVFVWDFQTGKCLRELQEHTELIFNVNISADGRLAVSCSYDDTVRVCDLEKGVSQSIPQRHTGKISDMVITPDGRMGLSVGSNMCAWDMETGSYLRIFKGHTERIVSVSISSDSQIAVSASWDKTLRIWNLTTGSCMHVLKGHTKHVNAVCISPNDQYVVSGSQDKTLRVWDLKTGVCLNVLTGHLEGIDSIRVTSDSKFAVSLSYDRSVRIWNLKRGVCLRVLGASKDDIRNISLAPDSRHAITGPGRISVTVWDIINGSRIRELVGHEDLILSASISPDNKCVITSSKDKTIRIWDIETGKCLGILRGHTSWVFSVNIISDGNRAISASDDKTVRIWDIDTLSCIAVLYLSATRPIVSISNHNQLIEGTSYGEVFVYKLHEKTLEDEKINTYGSSGFGKKQAKKVNIKFSFHHIQDYLISLQIFLFYIKSLNITGKIKTICSFKKNIIAFPPKSNFSSSDILMQQMKESGSLGKHNWFQRWYSGLKERPLGIPLYTAINDRACIAICLSKDFFSDLNSIRSVVQNHCPFILHIASFLEGSYPLLRTNLICLDNPKDPLIFEAPLDIRNGEVQEFCHAVMQSEYITLILILDSRYYEFTYEGAGLSVLFKKELRKIINNMKPSLSQSDLNQSFILLGNKYKSLNDGITTEKCVTLVFTRGVPGLSALEFESNT